MRASLILATAIGCGAPPPAPAPAPVTAPAPAHVAAPAPAAAPAPVASAPIPVPGRLVAIGDVHGDPAHFLRVLQETGITDAAAKWIAGDTVLVQTGDVTDRGPDSRGVIRMIADLERQAPASGGRVVALNGNHEIMNLVGDWRYVSEGDLAVYGGIEARTAAYAPDGEDGRRLRALDAVQLVGDTVFCHGGVKPEFAALGIDGMNRKIREAVADADVHRAPPGPDGAIPPYKSPAPILGPDGPLWYRGYVLDPEEQACPLLADALGKLGAKRMVVGHTTSDDGRIQVRCGGALVAIDTGISEHYGAHHAAFEAKSGDGVAIYPTGREDLPDPKP